MVWCFTILSAFTFFKYESGQTVFKALFLPNGQTFG